MLCEQQSKYKHGKDSLDKILLHEMSHGIKILVVTLASLGRCSYNILYSLTHE